MDERNVLSGVTATALAGFVDFFQPLAWMSLVGLCLVVLDYRFGLAAARIRGEQIRKSRARRRTANKIVDYICWVFLAATLNQAVAEPLSIPLLPMLVMLFIYRIEIDSVYGNWCESRGQKRKSLWKILIAIFSKKDKMFEVLNYEDENEDEVKDKLKVE